MVHRHIRPVVAGLRLAHTMHFLQVMKRLFNGRAVGDGFQNLRYAGVDMGAKISTPRAIVFFHEHHADQPTSRLIGCQKCFVTLERFDAVQDKRSTLPTSTMPCPFGEADFFLAVGARSAWTAPSWWNWFRHVEQRCVLAQTTDDDGPRRPGRFQKRALGISSIDYHPQGSPQKTRARRRP